MENNEYRNKPYCKGCDDRIQPGKAYIKKDINSAWYVVIGMTINNNSDIVHFRKIDLMNIPYEQEVCSDTIYTLFLEDFVNKFEFVSTIFCPYEIDLAWQPEKEGNNC